MTTFAPRQPDLPISVPHKPLVTNSGMGDGWVQRIESGLNNDLPPVNLTWTVLTAAEATYINDFFATRKGVTKFEYQPPHVSYSSAKNFICQDWTVDKIAGSDHYNATAVIQQVPL